MVASWLSAARILPSIGAIAVAGDGLQRAETRLVAEVMDLLNNPGMGMTTLVGSQANVLLTRSALVSHTHTR